MKTGQSAVVSGLVLMLLSAAGDCLENEFEVTLISDYVWRGVSQSQGKAALQASIDAGRTFDSGWHLAVGMWGSTLDFTEPGDPEDGAHYELNPYLLIAKSVSQNWDAAAQYIQYIYPGTNAGVDYDYDEFILKLTHKDMISATVAYSGNVFASRKSGTLYEVSGEFELPQDLVFSTCIGYYDLHRAYDDSYAYVDLGLWRTWSDITVGAQLIATDNDGKAMWGESVTGTRMVLSISAEF